MKSSQSNFNLRSPGSYLARSYLIATVNEQTRINEYGGKIYYFFIYYMKNESMVENLLIWYMKNWLLKISKKDDEKTLLLEIIWLYEIISYILPMVLLHKYFSPIWKDYAYLYFKKCFSLFKKLFLLKTFYSPFFKKWSHSTEKKVISQKKRLSQDEEKVFSEKNLFYFFENAHLKKRK